MSIRARIARFVGGNPHQSVPAAVRMNRRKDVLFVSGPGGAARRYRCDHRAEELELAGASTDVTYREGLPLAEISGHYRCIVLYRVPWDEGVDELLMVAPSFGCRVVSDFDDLVFDPAVKELIHGRSRLSVTDRVAFDDSLGRMQRTLQATDATTVSTEPLAEAARDHQLSVAVVFNSVSAAMVDAADSTLRLRRDRPVVTVAYLSGTQTHDRDFLEAADGVLWILERFPHVRFHAIGHLRLDERFDLFGDRVSRIPYQPWQRLPRSLAEVDVNLAPLEGGNAFVDAKSCLKYIEAGVMGIPTIASPRPDFRRVIAHGANGFLADSPSEWRAALETLVTDGDARHLIGEAARRDVLERHTTAARATQTRAAFAIDRDATAG